MKPKRARGRLKYLTEKDWKDLKIHWDEPLLTSGVVCRLLDVPVWVLKQLDAHGIICPRRKSNQSSRLYSLREYQKLKQCWYYLNEHGVKIQGLKVILEMLEEQ